MILRNIKGSHQYFKYNSFQNLIYKHKFPYLRFNVNDMNIDTNSVDYKNILLSYSNLEIDPYLDTIVPKRLRKYGLYNVKYISDVLQFEGKHNIKLNINNIQTTKYKQNVSDSRNKIREFTYMDESVITSTTMINMISYLSSLVKHINPCISEINIHVHQVRLISFPDDSVSNSPEGVHQDGSDYIVSALVLNKFNIDGGCSIIKDEHKETIYETILEKNDGLFQEDKHLWHYITNMESLDNRFIGYRDILGFDIDILKYKLNCDN